MKNTILFAAFCITVTALSCKKEDTVSTPVSVISTYSSMDTIYQMLEVKPKYVSVNGATGGTFYGNSGTRYVIPANCLQDGAGNPVTTNVQFEVAEYLKKGDMIFSKMLPISDGEPLISGGEISIHATLSGQPIYLRPGGCTVSATIPKDKDTVSGMQFFAGVPVAQPGTTKVNWTLKRDSVGLAGAILYNGDTINILCDSLESCNADRFLTSPNYQSFEVTIGLSGSATLSSITELKGFTLYDNYKGVWPLNSYSNGVYSEHHVPNIPVHIAVYGLINGHFYGGVIGITPQTGNNYSITLSEVDPIAFKGQLNNLTN
jgi:hypothetical protein